MGRIGLIYKGQTEVWDLVGLVCEIWGKKWDRLRKMGDVGRSERGVPPLPPVGPVCGGGVRTRF